MKPEYGLFYYKRRISAGWIAGEQGGKCLLRLHGGERATYPAGQVLYRWEGESARTKHGTGALEQLGRWYPSLTSAKAAEINLVHRKLPKGAEIPFAQIAQRVLSPDADGWRRARLYWGLLRFDRFFRPQGGGFVARGAAERRQWEARRAAAKIRKQRQRQAAEWRAALERGERPQGKGAAQFLRQMVSLLMEGRGSAYWEELALPLGLRRGEAEETQTKLRAWLEVAGAWPGWPNLWLQWSGVARAFPHELVSAASRVSRQKPNFRGRADFRKQPTYSIDVAGSRDLDDAITIIACDHTSLTAAVHIAQPTPSLAPGDRLFEEAAQRASSVYTVQGLFPMFPAALSAGRFSLLRGKEREVVTFLLRVSPKSGELLEVKEGIIRVAANLDYEQADARLIRKSPDWARLSEICDSLQAGRVARGAQLSERVDTVIDASQPHHVRLQLYDRRGAAQRIVEELAVLLNREAGRYCREHNLPAIYRVQPKPRIGGKAGRGFPRAASFTTSGAPHAGLACDRYVQITSPIRRFPDLVMQQQIAGHAIHGRVTYPDDKQLRGWGFHADTRMAAYAGLESRIRDYWKRLFLSQQSGKIFQGSVRRLGKGGPGKVWLGDLQLMVDAVLPPGAEVRETLNFRVKLADPENHLLCLEVK